MDHRLTVPAPAGSSVRPDPLERLATVLLDRLGPAWVSDTRPGEKAVVLLHVGSGRRIGADPRESRIVMQAWTKGSGHVTPTAHYTPDTTGHPGLDHWLSTGDLTDAGAVMATALNQLLAQLPGPDTEPAEEVLTRQATLLAHKAREFAAGLIHRRPAGQAAREIAALAAQLVEMADATYTQRGH
ncbi:hypothetical protein [Streptomyces sp. NPDC088915]|uniref:hypothetical protein n=1 Tax=Streptomyces sp. NPDC088915 TaxID=3365912 RepID=UPI003824DF6D